MDVDGFVKYRCDRPMPLGVNLGSLTKVLKCAKDDDICTLKATDDADVLNLTYEAKSECQDFVFSRVSLESVQIYLISYPFRTHNLLSILTNTPFQIPTVSPNTI